MVETASQEDSASDGEVKEKAPKAKSASAKKAGKKAAKKGAKKASKKAAKASDDATGEMTPPKEKADMPDEGTAPKAKKGAKKAGKKAAKKSAKKAAKKAASQTASDANTPPVAEERAPISSAPVDVVEVGSDNGASKPKKGWWSR